MPKYFYSSLTRISNLEDSNFAVGPLPREKWRTGDYVVGLADPSPGDYTTIELPTGRQLEVVRGDRVVGALGRRCATLEAVGDWKAVGEDLRLDALTAAGVFGRCTSISSFLSPLLLLDYVGHVLVNGGPANMKDFVRPTFPTPCSIPLILIIGTSMESGKTLSAKVIIRLLKARGLRIAGAKFTGVGRYRDILAMSDAGADFIYDFVDAGLPSTCCEEREYEGVIEHMLARIANEHVDVIVGEAGASPLEPYNGTVAVARLQQIVACTVLCASDPYAVLGVVEAFHMKPDLIAGRAACTTSGIELVERLCGIKALDLTNPRSASELEALLARVLPKK